MSNLKTYGSRTSACNYLRKVGLDKAFYATVIQHFPAEGTFIVDLDKVNNLVNRVELLAPAKPAKSAKPIKVKPRKVAKDEVPPPKPKIKNGAAAGPQSIGSFMRGLIADGKTNAEVWDAAVKLFPTLDATKRHYPSWYRSEMKRKGLLPRDA